MDAHSFKKRKLKTSEMKQSPAFQSFLSPKLTKKSSSKKVSINVNDVKISNPLSSIENTIEEKMNTPLTITPSKNANKIFGILKSPANSLLRTPKARRSVHFADAGHVKSNSCLRFSPITPNSKLNSKKEQMLPSENSASEFIHENEISNSDSKKKVETKSTGLPMTKQEESPSIHPFDRENAMISKKDVKLNGSDTINPLVSMSKTAMQSPIRIVASENQTDSRFDQIQKMGSIRKPNAQQFDPIKSIESQSLTKKIDQSQNPSLNQNMAETQPSFLRASSPTDDFTEVRYSNLSPISFFKRFKQECKTQYRRIRSEYKGQNLILQSVKETLKHFVQEAEEILFGIESLLDSESKIDQRKIIAFNEKKMLEKELEAVLREEEAWDSVQDHLDEYLENSQFDNFNNVLEIENVYKNVPDEFFSLKNKYDSVMRKIELQVDCMQSKLDHIDRECNKAENVRHALSKKLHNEFFSDLGEGNPKALLQSLVGNN